MIVGVSEVVRPSGAARIRLGEAGYVSRASEIGTPHSPLRILLAGLALALCFGLAVTKASSYDTWVHLSLGRWMAEHRRQPLHNELSYTQPERPTPDHQWLFQAGLYQLWRLAGIDGATLVKAGIVAAAFGLALATARRKGADLAVAAVVVVLAAGAARFRFTLRPQVVALLLASVYLWLLERWRGGGSRGLLLLLPLQVLWANVHGSALIGCGLAIGYAAAESIRHHFGFRISDFGLKSGIGNRKSEMVWLWLAALALIPLTMLNPHGAGVLSLPFTHAAKQVSWGLKELLQDRAAVAWADIGGRHVCFAILAAIGAASLVGSLVRRDVTELGLFAGTLAAAAYSERFIDLFALASAPVAARNLTALLRKPLAGIAPHILACLGTVAMLGIAALAKVSSDRDVPFGLGVAEGLFPEQELAFIQAHYPTGNLFNEFEHGGYICWRTRRAVFLDSRGELAYDMAFIRTYVDAWESRERWRELVERYDLAVALVARRPLQAVVRADGQWEQVLQGPVCAVFIRKPSTAANHHP
ncbi:MAG: hypothetical protein FJ291_05115 [Planctomycetes bacterium]|nr:hypothetical protein [Planctomycetota bacterium]